jgi:hypothetical protein
VCSSGPDGENGKLVVVMVRSWTGFRIAELEIEGVTAAMLEPTLKDVTGQVRIRKVTYAIGDDYEVSEETAKNTVREVARWVLGVELP